jgi:putative oxidoreductase
MMNDILECIYITLRRMLSNIHALVHRLHNPDAGILLIRIAVGLIFLLHGWSKLQGMDNVVAWFATLGFPAFLAYFVAWSEVLGGLALLVGIFVRYVGILLGIIMVVAIIKVHIDKGYSVATGGYEFALVLMLGAFAITTFGAGAYSLARYLKG